MAAKAPLSLIRETKNCNVHTVKEYSNNQIGYKTTSRNNIQQQQKQMTMEIKRKVKAAPLQRTLVVRLPKLPRIHLAPPQQKQQHLLIQIVIQRK